MARTARRPFKIDLQPVIESLGMEEVIRQAGVARVLEQIGEKEIVRHIGVEGFLANLSPEQLRELKRRLNGAGNSRDE